jgi:hypothetical protein
MYLKMEEAEELKRTYSSWIGKRAHIGKGQTDTLQAIHVQPKRTFKGHRPGKELYRVEFEFSNKKRYSAIEFLFYNSLILGQAYDGMIKQKVNSLRSAS